MKVVHLFVFLITFISCQHTISHEGLHVERFQNKEKIQKEIFECILKENISSELKTKLEENKEKDLRDTIHSLINKLNDKDREIIRKCRREAFGNIKEKFKKRNLNSFANRNGHNQNRIFKGPINKV